MPRQNTGRTLGVEDLVADRIAQYREQRGETYEGLAARMTAEGCAIHASALYKIEKGEPRRRITVDELVALAAVFGVSLDELTKPLPTGGVAKALELAQAYRALERDLRTLQAEEKRLTDELADVVKRREAAMRAAQKAVMPMGQALRALPSKERNEVVMAAGLDAQWLAKPGSKK